jgi:NAD(P)H dehydrogenase (quinone)
LQFTLLRNGWYTENYTDQLSNYQGRQDPRSRWPWQDPSGFAPRLRTATAVALLQNEGANRTPPFDLPLLTGIISEVTGTKVVYRNLWVNEYADVLQKDGLDQATANFVAALDASITRGDLETSSADLPNLLGRAATGPTEIVRAAYKGLKFTSGA